MTLKLTPTLELSLGLKNALAPNVLFRKDVISVKPSSLASKPSLDREAPKIVIPFFRSSATDDKLNVKFLSCASFLIMARFEPISHVFKMGSFVMILTVPAMALDPNNAEPPLRTISTRSIVFVGICSKP